MGLTYKRISPVETAGESYIFANSVQSRAFISGTCYQNCNQAGLIQNRIQCRSRPPPHPLRCGDDYREPLPIMPRCSQLYRSACSERCSRENLLASVLTDLAYYCLT